MKTNEISFTLEKLKKVINKLNAFLNESQDNSNSNKSEEYTEKLKKLLNYINKYSESLKNASEENVLEYLIFIAENLSEKVYEKQGDEIMEELWKLYRINTDQLKFNPNKILNKINSSKNNLECQVNNNPEYFLNLVLMNENLTEKLLKDQIITFNNEKKEVKFDLELSKLIAILKVQNESANLSIKINNILDMIFLKILCIGNMKTFYTILSSMLMLTEGKTILIFKIISYFALCLYTFENKESFIGSILFIIGGMLRDYAKSYLKTKGLERIIFSEHKCSHQDHERQFFKISILNSNESEFLENNFLDIIKEFLSILVFSTYENSKTESKWDNYKNIFIKYLYCDKMDMEESLPSDIQITQYLTLFITEFLFTFICGFCEFDSNKKIIKTHFKNFDNFSLFVLEFLSSKFNNILTLYEMVQKKITFMQTDCEKTEYVLTDKFNAYGVYYLILLAFNTSFNNNLKDALENEIIEHFNKNKFNYFPKVLSNEYNSIILLDILKNIISIETHFSGKGKLCVFYENIVDSYLDSIINLFGNKRIKFVDLSRSNSINFINTKIYFINNSYSKYFSSFILEYLKLKAEDRNEKQLTQLSSLFEDKLFLINDVSKNLRSKDDYLRLMEFYNILSLSGVLEEKLVLTSLILIFVKGINSDYLLDIKLADKIREQVNKTKNISKLTYEIAINDIIEDLKSGVDSPKKLNIKHKNDPNYEFYDCFVIKNIDDKLEFIQVFESLLELLK